MIWSKSSALEFLWSFVPNKDPLAFLKTWLLDGLIADLLVGDGPFKKSFIGQQLSMANMLQVRFPILLRGVDVIGQVGVRQYMWVDTVQEVKGTMISCDMGMNLGSK